MDSEQLLLFEQYTSGSLKEESAKDFETRLESDQEFKKEFEEYIQIVNGINFFERERLKELIKNNQVRFMNKKSRRRTVWAFVSSAAIILILIIPTFIIYRTTSYKPRLVTEYYIKDPGLPITMGEGVYPLLDMAMIEYKDGNFEESLNDLKQLLVLKPLNDTLNYYAAICYYEMGNIYKSIEHNRKITSAESAYFFRAKYNLALDYIKVREFEKAKTELREIISGDSGPLKDKALQVLEKL